MQTSRRYRFVAIGILAIGIIFSVLIWSITSRAIHNTEQARFDHYAKMIRELISSQFHEYIAAVRGTRAFVDSSEHVTREEWQRYTANFSADPHFENIHNISFIRLVPRTHLSAFLAEIRNGDTPGIQVSTSGNQDDLFIIEYTQADSKEPLHAGQDIGDDPLLRAALIKAARSNEIILSGITAKAENGMSSSLMLLLPVYHGNSSLETESQRWQALRGWVGAPVRTGKMLAEILGHFTIPLDLEIFDNQTSGTMSLVYDADGTIWTPEAAHKAAVDAKVFNTSSLQVADRTWTISIFALAGLSTPIEHHTPEILLLGGIVLSLFCSLLVISYAKTLERAEALARNMTADLQKSEQRFQNLFRKHNTTMLLVDPENGRIIDANKAASLFYGYTGEELKNLSVDELNPLPKETIANFRRQVVQGKANLFEFQHRIASGELRDVEVHTSPIDFAGKVALFSIIHDITPRKKAENALRQSEMRFRSLYLSNPDPVLLYDLAEDKIIDVNLAFESSIHILRIEALRHSDQQIGLWAAPARREEFWQTFARQGTVDHFEADFLIVGNGPRTGLFSARRLDIDEKQYALVTIRDISTEKAAERSLLEMNRIKSEFISTAAHELRTPLSAIMGFVELLSIPEFKEKISEEKKLEFLGAIYERGEALSRIIDDLLDISRIESGVPIALNRTQTDFIAFLNKALGLYQILNHDRELRVILPDEMNAPGIDIDQQRINQVIENLLSNAVKYSAPGSYITIQGSFDEKGWTVEVSDEGIGMNEEQASHVFEKFYRANSSDTAIGGLGIGMSIAKQIIDAHGGSIWIDSHPGHGTKVGIFLPFSY